MLGMYWVLIKFVKLMNELMHETLLLSTVLGHITDTHEMFAMTNISHLTKMFSLPSTMPAT